MKCHRIGEQGGHIGPDLSGAGRRFSKIHLVESILEPSLSIAPSFQNYALRLKDDRILNGVRVAEKETTLMLGDVDGKDQPARKADIEEEKALAPSLVPEGLEKAITKKDFAGLAAFLVSQK